MASCWIFSAVVLAGFLAPADVQSLPDGTHPENTEPPANTGGWKWEAAADGRHGSSPPLRQKRQDPMKKQAKRPPPVLTTAADPSTALREESAPPPTETVAARAPTGSPTKVGLPETKSKTESRHPRLAGTTPWPWLVDVTSKAPQGALPTGTSQQGSEATGPVSRRKGPLSPSSFKKATPTWAFLDHRSASPSPDLTGGPATQKQAPDSPTPDVKSKRTLPLITAASGSTATPQHLDEISSSSQALVDDLEFSTAPQGHRSDAGRPVLNPRARPPRPTATPAPHKTQKWPRDVASTPLAFSTRPPRHSWRVTAPGSSAATRGRPPLPNGANPLVGKCLLALLLLGLVAAIFIVCAGVLAIVLWRQKRAYKLGQANHTEMVCISSLLSAEKEEEEEERRRRRQPKAQRVHLLGETASETEVDNLTLNSFLPEH